MSAVQLELPLGLKCCTRCGVSKPLDDFYLHATGRDGRRARCKPCVAEAQTAWRVRNQERVNANAARWRAENPDRTAVYQQRWRARYPERARAVTEGWRLANKEKGSEYALKWQANNPEKVRAHRVMRNALKYGRLVRGEVCEDCGAGGRMDGHHEDYSRPLDVVWLCRKCHTKRRR